MRYDSRLRSLSIVTTYISQVETLSLDICIRELAFVKTGNPTERNTT